MLPEKIYPVKSGSIWIHALSVGEVFSAMPLARILCSIKHKAGIALPILMSTSTSSGFKALQSSGLSLDGIFTMPLDAPWLMKRLVDRIRPSVFILMEGDVWFNMLRSLKASGSKCFLVNARMSPKSFLGYTRLRKLGINLFKFFDAIFLSSPDMRRFYGEFVDESKIFFLGNIKWDAVREKSISAEERLSILEELGITGNTPVWIAGSVHAGEEGAIIKAHREILSRVPDALLILAPRKIPEDVGRFEKVSIKEGFVTVRRSSREKISKPSTVYLVDTLGELMRFYSIANVAFVGGSLVPKGGHNLLEPAIYGIPVCWGPHIFNFQDIAETLKNSGQGTEVNDRNLADFILKHLPSRESTCQKNYPSEASLNSGSPTISVLSKIFSMVLERSC
jgi:3-deoxy-D-manno-octulosonic-acid transferase